MRANDLYVGKPWNFPYYGDGCTTLEDYPTRKLLDPHPDFLWYDSYGKPHSIGTSLFLGPQTPRYAFSSKMQLYCPESVKWNRMLYYAMNDPKLFDCLPKRMQDRILQKLTLKVYEHSVIVEQQYVLPEPGPYAVEHHDSKVSLSGIAGVWSIWGRCNQMGPMMCLDVHECQDLEYEMRMHHGMLEEAKKYDWNDEYFYRTTEDRDGSVLFGKSYGPGMIFSMERRSKAISRWYDLEVRVIAMGLGGEPGDKFLRECVEAQIAWEWKALYWNRTFFQAVTQRMVKSQLEVENVMKKT